MTNAFFKSIENSVKSLFTEAESEAMVFLDALAASIEANGGAVLRAAAVNAVAAAEAVGGSATVKLAAATTSIIATLTSQGIPVVENAVNGAIEAAVAALPANVAVSPAPAPTPGEGGTLAQG
jgi:hypothetical protein